MQSTHALLITVNYRGEGATAAFVASLSKLRHFPDLSVIVVDNASGNESLTIVKAAIARFPNVILIESPTNLGYFGAARFALKRYLAGRTFPDWVIVCNNDILIDDEEFLPKLFRHDPQSVGVIGPRILAMPLNVDQNPCMQRRPGWRKRLELRVCSSNYLAAVIRDWFGEQKRMLKLWATRTGGNGHAEKGAALRPMYAAHGSFFIFSRRFFEAGGYLDENLFLFGEEISVAEICRSLHLVVLYDASLAVKHHEHASIGKHMTRLVHENHKKATQYVLSKYLSR